MSEAGRPEDPKPDPDPNESIASSPTPPPSDSDLTIPKDGSKPKRLTLHERLALAAQKKKKAKSETGASNSEKEQEPHQEPQLPESNNSSQSSEISQLQQELSALKLQQTKTLNENKQLKKELANKSKSDDTAKKLAEKDETIAQLLEEGKALSAKEVKLQEKIRQFAATNSELEALLRGYSEKNEDALLKLEEVESLLKSHKLKSIDQLLDLMQENSKKLLEAQKALEAEKLQNWEGKYKEQQKQHEADVDNRRETARQLNDLNIQLEMLKNQSKLDLSLKDSLISKLKQDMFALKDENAAEVARLESKIEGLRSENESFVKSASDSITTPENTSADSSIAYSEYAKLSESHKNLQSQFLSSQENWKLIESNLLKKVENISSSAEALRKSKNQAQYECKKLVRQVSTLQDEVDALKLQKKTLETQLKETRFDYQLKQKELDDLESKQEELTGVYNSSRTNYEAQIEQLTSKSEQLEAQLRELQTQSPMNNVESFASIQSKRIRDGGLHINMDPSVRSPSRNISMSSIPEPTELQELPSLNPFDNRQTFHNNLSSLSVQDDIGPSDAPEITVDDSFSYWRTPTERSVVPTGDSGKNVQLLSRMSGNIRRLEVEIMGLKEENQRLAADKDEALRQIVADQKIIDDADELRKKIESLEQEIQAKSNREKTLLELIGEKSETVDELKADVQDLKDLCKQQVQQMIEMVGK